MLIICFIYYTSFIIIFIKLFTVSDELLLVEIRSTTVQENLSDEALKGPNLEAIARATSNLPSRNTPKIVPSTECPADVNISYSLKRYFT